MSEAVQANALLKRINIACRKIITGFLLAAVLMGCRPSKEELTLQNKNTIRSALNGLLARTNEHAFVIFEERSSRKFVQFAVSPLRGLQLDLPEQPLNPQELKRAKAMFGLLGVELETWQILDAPGGKPLRDQSGFQLWMGRDVDWAVALVNKVFVDVYRFAPEFELVVKDN